MEAKTLALYLGCDAEALVHYSGKPSQWVNCIIVGVNGSNAIVKHRDIYDVPWLHNSERQDVKLHLRPLSSMTEEEKNEIGKMLHPKCDTHEVNTFMDALQVKSYGDGTRVLTDNYTPKIFLHLLSRGFDLFGLIEKGEAIDATKIN